MPQKIVEDNFSVFYKFIFREPILEIFSLHYLNPNSKIWLFGHLILKLEPTIQIIAENLKIIKLLFIYFIYLFQGWIGPCFSLGVSEPDNTCRMDTDVALSNSAIQCQKALLSFDKVVVRTE